MFAALCTEAGPLDLPRAEAFADKKPHHYNFYWYELPFSISEETVVFARLYISREGGECIGMAPLLNQDHAFIVEGSSITLGPWYIRIPPSGLVKAEAEPVD